jgi:hypothetical protein
LLGNGAECRGCSKIHDDEASLIVKKCGVGMRR